MRRRTNVRMTRIVLAISFIILFGRMIYAGIGAISHHQDKQQSAVSVLTSETASRSNPP